MIPIRRFLTSSLLRLALASALGALCGCVQKSDPLEFLKTGPFYTPRNSVGVSRLPLSVQRVVLLPVHSEEGAAQEVVLDLDPIFSNALSRQMRFEVVTLSRDECQRTFGLADVSSTEALPHDFLAILGEKMGADAVMFVDITQMRSYRPLALGIRAKLASVKDKNLLWEFDEVVSASDQAVVNSVRRYYLRNDRPGMPVDTSTAALESPNRFAAFAADAAFHTLPPR